jgi:hypothetical protein
MYKEITPFSFRKPDALLVPQKEELEKKKTVHRLTKMNIDLKTKT